MYELLDTLKSFSGILAKSWYITGVFRLLRNERTGKRFPHTRLGVWVQVCGGFRSRGLCKVEFLFCHPPLPDMPHPSTREVSLTVLILKPLFCVFVRQICCYVNKGQALWFGLAWLPAVREKQSFGLIWLKWTTHKSTVLNKTIAHARLALDEFLINFWHFFPQLDVFCFNRPIKKQ